MNPKTFLIPPPRQTVVINGGKECWYVESGKNTLFSVKLTEEGTIEIIHRKEGVYMQFLNPLLLPTPVKYPDKVWKEIYGSVKGKIELIKVIDGKHIPEKTIPESFEFPE